MLSHMPFCFSFKIMSYNVLYFIKCSKNCYTFDDLRYILYQEKNETLRSSPPTFNMVLGQLPPRKVAPG